MNIYCYFNRLGNLQITYGDYFKAQCNAVSVVRLIPSSINVDDVLYGRVDFDSLPKF